MRFGPVPRRSTAGTPVSRLNRSVSETSGHSCSGEDARSSSKRYRNSFRPRRLDSARGTQAKLRAVDRRRLCDVGPGARARAGSPRRAAGTRRRGEGRVEHGEPARADRGRNRHRQDAHAAGADRAALRGRCLGLRGRREGRRLGPRRRRARPTARRPSAPRSSASRSRRPASRSSTSSWAASAPACRCGPPSPTSARSCWPRSSSANETQEQSLALVFRYADQKGLPLLDLSDLRALLTFLDSDAGKAELDGHRRSLLADRGRAAPRPRRARGRRRQRVLRRAAVRHLRPAAHRPRRPRGHLLPRAAGRPGQAEALLDRPDVASRRAVRGAARRSATSTSRSSCFFFDEAHLLFDGATQGLHRLGRRRRCG